MRITALLSKIPPHEYILLSTPEDMRYYSGFTGEGYVLLSEPDRIVYTDGRYTEQAEKECVDFSVRNIREMKKELEGLDKTVYFQERRMNYADFLGLSKSVNLKPSGIDFQLLRSVKDETEIENLKKAAQIAEIAFENTLSFISAGKTEKEIAAYLNYQMALQGGEKTSFDTICISGINTSLPHGRPGDKKINEGEFLTLDFGCVYNGYCSDMTRTICIGNPTDKMRTIYNTVLEAQLKALDLISAERTGAEIDAAARDFINNNGYEGKFGHALGHSLGLEIHESPNFSAGETGLIPQGAVISVEPGIYLDGEFGVRIEDIVNITENGCKNLTKSTKELIIL